MHVSTMLIYYFYNIRKVTIFYLLTKFMFDRVGINRTMNLCA